MSLEIRTERLVLTLRSAGEWKQQLASMSDEERSQVSAEWLARVESADDADPWIHGFRVLRADDSVEIGSCGFKAPPEDGVVEIAYAIDPPARGQGYATEAAMGLVEFAWADPRVQVVQAHTMPEKNASTRILTKCGFDHVGEFVDPEDGPVWRWSLWR